MTYPTPDDTWIFHVNKKAVSTGVTEDDARQKIWMAKDGLVSTSGWTDSTGAAATQNHPWTVQSSSDHSSAGTSDLWTGYNKLISEAAGVAHSWIVLVHPTFNIAGAAGFSFGINLNSFSTSRVPTLYLSAHGYNTDGTITNFPTTRAPVSGGSAGQWSTTSTIYNGAPEDVIMHTICSTDGKRWRQIGGTGGKVFWILMIDELVEPTGSVDVTGNAWWPGSYVGFFNSGSSELTNDSILAQKFYGNVRDASGDWVHHNPIGAAMWHEDNNFVDRVPSKNELTNEYPIDPIHIYGIEGSARGYAGRLADTYITNDPAVLANCTTFDTQSYAAIAGLVLPWNETTPILS